ncbi:hypothetical protein F2P81_015720 [Scophthalmus maximus]|uniref:Uncharacterized protein n=1 Tax=Scophthalmus maximus TaxID=52904 RepID=A0A6A4SF43_SCOMX|nr:hypothetical protein F2P81_015720 [Scophthalmus maximus]
MAGCTSLYKKDMLGHFGCVNAIEFSNNGGEWLVSGTQFKLGLSVPIRLFCDDDDDDDDTTEGAFPEEKNKRHIQLSKTPGAR